MSPAEEIAMNLWAALMLVAAGLFAGGTTSFVWFRFGIWRRMAVPDFIDDFTQTLRRTDRVQPVLLLVSIVASTGFAATTEATARVLALLGAGLFLTTLVSSVVVLVPLQRKIIGSKHQQRVETLRRQWFRGHFGRSVLSVMAFAITALAVTI
jgi:Domain of unknown function (DUF1772)